MMRCAMTSEELKILGIELWSKIMNMPGCNIEREKSDFCKERGLKLASNCVLCEKYVYFGCCAGCGLDYMYGSCFQDKNPYNQLRTMYELKAVKKIKWRKFCQQIIEDINISTFEKPICIKQDDLLLTMYSIHHQDTKNKLYGCRLSLYTYDKQVILLNKQITLYERYLYDTKNTALKILYEDVKKLSKNTSELIGKVEKLLGKEVES